MTERFWAEVAICGLHQAIREALFNEGLRPTRENVVHSCLTLDPDSWEGDE